MGVPIRVQKIPEPRGVAAGEALAVPLLTGVIEGVETAYVLQGEGSRRRLLQEPGRSLAVFFFSGAGIVESGSARHSFSTLAAFVGRSAVPLALLAASPWIEYLEIRLERAEADWEAIRDRSDLFVPYSECPPYGEAIKSASTTSRTIFPPDIVPRFCMGSVETRGPDAVGAHTHPIVEQLFWGLPDNDCVVTADEETAAFEERMLLHVPPGSRHGVGVGGGKRLHYLWMDFFRAAEDLAYIHQQHRPLGNTPWSKRSAAATG